MILYRYTRVLYRVILNELHDEDLHKNRRFRRVLKTRVNLCIRYDHIVTDPYTTAAGIKNT